MQFFNLDFQQCSIEDFITFWDKCYDEGKYSDEDYEKKLNVKGLLSESGIQFLLEWKNAKPLPKKKQRIADGMKRNLKKVNEFRKLSEVSEKDFNSFWSFIQFLIRSGIVYRVFLLHISRPNDYPIVDQHVLRAWNFLTRGQVEDPEQTMDNYWKYRIFFFKMANRSGKSLRSVDRALMAFGQFLVSQFYQKHSMPA